MSNQRDAVPAPHGKQSFIGFAPPLLGAEPVRLPVVGCGLGLLALGLPGGMAADADPLNPLGVTLVVSALREQLASAKPELVRLGMKSVQSIFNLEPEMSGIALFGMSKAATEFWRNAYGSEQLRLRFVLVCESAPELPDVINCDLPIARHRDGSQMLVSHKSGKKTFTSFRRLTVAQPPKGKPNPLFNKELWEATVTYLRPHQIRLHAYEVGLRVCGENHYAQVPSFYLSELKGLRHRLSDEQPLWSGPMVHLAGIEPVDAAAFAQVEASADRLHGYAPEGDGTGLYDDTGEAPNASTQAGAGGAPCWPLSAPLPRSLALAARLLFGDSVSGL